MGLSCPLGIARFGPAKKKTPRKLEDALHSFLTLQNETIYKTLIITSVWQDQMYENKFTTVKFENYERKHSPARWMRYLYLA